MRIVGLKIKIKSISEIKTKFKITKVDKSMQSN